MTLNSHLVRLVLLLFVLKVVYVIYGYIYLGMSSGFNFFSLIELFNKNDAGWYQNIVENGYPTINSIEELGEIIMAKIIGKVHGRSFHCIH